MAEDHTVQPGECISSLAHNNGFFWETVWNHAHNSQLKETRKDPNILFPGDLVYIPDLRPRIENRPVDQRHTFRRKGVPAKLRIRLMRPDPDQSPAPRKPPPQHGAKHLVDGDPEPSGAKEKEVPRANVPYLLTIDDVETSGKTDADGFIEISIPPNAAEGTLTIEPGTADETIIPLQIGHLDPITEIGGIKQRLANLGMDCGDRTDEVTDSFSRAVTVFQEKYGLKITGEADQSTRDKLRSVHGS